MFGMGRLAKLTQPDETIPGSVWAFLASAVGSVVGGLTGSTPVIVQVETAAGINEGGRTGLTAVTIGVMFLCSVFLAPLFGTVCRLEWTRREWVDCIIVCYIHRSQQRPPLPASPKTIDYRCRRRRRPRSWCWWAP